MLTPERGAASLKIDLSHGAVTVYHGESGHILQHFTVREGAWEKMFDRIVATLVENAIPDPPRL